MRCVDCAAYDSVEGICVWGDDGFPAPCEREDIDRVDELDEMEAEVC